MIYTRRSVLKGSGNTILGVVAARPAMALLDNRWEPPPPIQDDRLKRLIQTAVDAAVNAGALYADARLTFTQEFVPSVTSPNRSETMGVGVRALVNGYWGFASSPLWNSAESARLGHSAVDQAKANGYGFGKSRRVELAPVLEPTSGDWIMPVKDDPFEMSLEEISDYFEGLSRFIRRLKLYQSSQILCHFMRQDKAFGSSLGQFTTQRIYRASGSVGVGIRNNEGRSTGFGLDCLSPAGLGFEHFRGQPLREYIVREHEEAMRDLDLPMVPSDVGRHMVLINQRGMGTLLSQTIGVATEIDRAMGFEANAGGTSYINAPDEMLNTLQVGSSQINITADRSAHGSVGRVRWDDEGIEPTHFTVVKNGILMNMQTNREGAGWIKSHYGNGRTQFSSFGCAYAPDAIDHPLVHSADLTLEPDAAVADDLDILRTGIEKGIELKSPDIDMDFQQISGLGSGRAYELRRGKRTAIMADIGVLFRTPELWKSIVQLGGKSDLRRFGMRSLKGEPRQEGYHDVLTPSAVVKEMTVIDIKRKA